MRQTEDVLRSLRRYVASAMGSPPWRVRLAMDARFQRPFAMVSAPTAVQSAGAGPSTYRDDLPFVIQLYPVEPSTAGPMRTTEAKLIALRAAEQLKQSILVGVVDQTDPTVAGAQCRIPLWDYHDEAGEPLPLEGAESIATQRFGPDFMWVVEDSVTADAKAEASQQQLFVGLVNLRVQWFRSSQVQSGGTALESIQFDFK